jgi:thiaminase (transcriptional activator TenA)
MTEGLAATLWRENADLAQASPENPFVRGLGDGTLSLPHFQGYVAQDAYFLDAFARAYALALARSPDREGLRSFFELLSGALEELRLHAGYAERWQVSLEGVTPRPATLAYTDFLLATASLGSVGETCAAMTPCMRLYAYLGRALAEAGGTRSENPYREWVETYASPDFQALAETLERLLDRYAADTLAIRTAYRRAMHLELAFFQASLD